MSERAARTRLWARRPGGEAISHRAALAGVLAGGAVALVLGLVALDRKSWWFDEAFNVSLARDEWLKYVLKAGYYEPSQALYLVFFKLWGIATPETEWYTRLPSVMGAVLTAVLVGVLGKQLFGPAVGALAALLVATNASMVAWSQQARTYTLATFVAVGVTILFLNAQRAAATNRRPWLVYGLAGGIGVYAHFFVGFVLLAHLVTFGRLAREQRRHLRDAWLIVVLAVLPALVANVVGENHGADWIRSTSLGGIWEAVEEVGGFNPAALVLGAVGAVIAMRSATAMRWRGALVVAWALVPLMGALAISGFKPLVAGRYLLVSAPALALLAAVALIAIRPRWIAAALAIVTVVLSAVEIADWYGRHPQDWRAAGRFGAAQERDGVTIALFPEGNYIPYQLYAPLPASCRRIPGHHEPRCDFRARGDQTLVLTTSARWRELPGASHYVVTKEQRFGETVRAVHLIRRRAQN